MPSLRDIFIQAAAGQRLRSMLTQLAARTDYNSAEIQQQIAQIDLSALHDRVERMVDRASIIAHAFDVMNQGAHPHPLAAFIHSIECMGNDTTDKEFQHLLTLWSRVVSGCLKPEEMTAEELRARADETHPRVYPPLGDFIL